MKITRRLLALLLALCLTFGNVMPAMATELTTEEPATVTEVETPTEPEVSGTTGIEDNPFDDEEPTEEPTQEPTEEPTPGKPSTPHEIVDAAYALGEGKTLEGTYTLTGKIIAVDTPYDSGYKNITVTIVVEGRENKPIKCYRLAGEGAEGLAKNDIITVTGTLTNYKNISIQFAQGCTLDNVVKGEPDPDVEAPTASLSFASDANRVSQDGNAQVWAANGITFTNTKHNSSNAVANYTNPVRLYKSSKVKVEYPGMTKIVFTCDGSQYVISEGELSALGNVAIDGYAVTLTLSSPADSIEFVTTAQRRLDSIDVYATGVSVDPVDPTEPAPTEPKPTEPKPTEPAPSEPAPSEPAGDGEQGLLATFTFGNVAPSTWADGSDVGASKSYTSGNYTLALTGCSKIYAGGHDADGKNFIKFGTSSVVGTLTFEVPEDVTSVELHLASYKAKTSKYTINGGAEVTLTAKNNDTAGNGSLYDTVTVDTSVNKTITLATVSNAPRMVMYAVLFYGEESGGTTTPTEPQPTEPAPTEPQPTEPKPTEPAPTEPQPTEPADSSAPSVGVAYKLGLEQVNLGQTLYITGNTANKDYYLETTADKSSAVDVYVEAVAGGHRIYFSKNGAKTYIDVYLTDTGYVNIRLTDAPTAVYTWNEQYKTFITNVNNTDYFLGTYNSYNTVSASKFSYISTNFPVAFYPVEGSGEPPVDPTEPEATEPTVDPTNPPADVAEVATLTFDDTAKRTEGSTSKQVWVENNITLTNTGSVNPQYYNPVRLYKNSAVKVEYPVAMTKIEFVAYDTSYANSLKTSLGSALGTVVVDTKTVTLVLTAPATSVEFTLTDAQVRLDSLTVYTKDTTVPEEPENNDPPADSVLTVAEALALAESKEAGVYTVGKYYVTGKIVSLGNYGSINIADESGVELYVYSVKGWDDMDPQPAIGDTVTVYGNLGKYNSTTPQMKNSEITEHIPAGGEPEATEPVATEPQPTEPPALGSEANPEQINFEWNMDGSAATITVVVPANTEYYVTFITGMMGGDMMLTINGEPYGIVNGSRFQPVVLPLLNETDAEQTYTLILTYPLGSQMNPDTLRVSVEGADEGEGFNYAWLDPDDMDGYLYSWTADADGKLTITMENGAAGWAYSIYNMNSYAQTEMHYSSDIPNVNSETIDVKAGDLIQVMVNTCGEDEYTIPGGTVGFTASFVMNVGSASNPMDIEFVWNEEWTAADAEVTVPANTTLYVQAYGIGGMLLSIDGAEATKLEGNPRMPVVIELINDTAEEKTFNLHVFYAPAAVGSMDNPAPIELGETVATLEAETQGYYYQYTATDRGTLSINVSGDGWVYSVNNLTAGIYGDMHWHDDDPVVATEAVTVNKGDEVVIMVNTYDPVNPWTAPAGTVTLNLTLASEPAGSEANPIDLESGYNSFELPEGVTARYYGYKATEAGTLSVSVYDANYGELAPTFTVNGETYSEPIAVAEGDYVVIYVECEGPGTLAIDLYFEAVPGTVNNPIAIEDPLIGAGATLNPEETVYYAVRNVGGSNMYIYAFGEEMVLELNGETYALPAHEELVLPIPDSGMGFFAPPIVFSITNYSWDLTQDVNFYFGYEPGHMTNPAEMVLGKNSAAIEAGTQGYYYKWTATGNGFLELTMNTKTGWNYVINNTTAGTYGDMYFSDMKPVPTKGYMAVSEGDEIEIVVNTYDPENPYSAPAGNIAFTTKLITSYTNALASGKSMTLKYINPTNGKTIANSSVKWDMFIYELDEYGDKILNEETWEFVTKPVPAEVATLKAGKLTAAAGLTEPVDIVVKGTYGETENIYNITIYPVATEIRIDAYVYGEDEGQLVPNVNGTTLTYDVGHQYIELGAIVNPDAALQDVTWKSSNTKILTVNDFGDGSIGLEPVVNTKTMKVGTGTVTLTATAKDGSGVKATVKVNVTCTAFEVYVSGKNNQSAIASGKSLTMVADVPFAVNKAVTWSAKVLNVADDFDHASVATISAKGVLTAAKGLTTEYEVEVTATAKDGSGAYGSTVITVVPAASKVVIDAPATHDLISGDLIYVSATALSMSGENVIYSSSDVTWTSSNKNIGAIAYEEDWDGTTIPVLVLTGKTGKVTLTATATDGSKVSAKATINVVRSPESLTLSTNDAVLAVGKSLTLKATVGPNNATDKKVIWSAKALVNDPVTGEAVDVTNDIGLTVKNGKVSMNTKKVKALIEEAGEYPVIEVTATANMADPYGQYATDSCQIQLCAATTKVNIIRFANIVNGKTLTMDDDAAMVLGVDYEPSDAGYYHNWKSSNTKIATVTNNWDGTVTVKPTGTKLGTVTITASAADGSGKSASVKVKIVRKVDKIDVDTSSFALSGTAKGKTFDLNKLITVSPSNASNKKVTWSIAAWSTKLAQDNKITLTAAGKLTAKMNVEAPVTITVVAEAADGLGASKSFQVTVTPATTKVTVKGIDGAEVTGTKELVIGETLVLTAATDPETASAKCTWKTSSAKVASIVLNEDGTYTVEAIKAGTAKITVTAADGSGKSATVTIKVVKPVPAT